MLPVAADLWIMNRLAAVRGHFSAVRKGTLLHQFLCREERESDRGFFINPELYL